MKCEQGKRIWLVVVILVSTILPGTSQSFKDDQLRYSRVRKAYSEKESIVKRMLNENDISLDQLRIYLRAFKKEKKLEVWAKGSGEDQFQLITTYDICSTSGELGPKRREGDYQIPEGYYHINIFNPFSNFYLSMGVNYPNRSDRILGSGGRLGGDIFIHGACVTIGCIPMTDDIIMEIYILAVEARNSGQTTIPVTIFPMKLTEENYASLISDYKGDQDKLGLWEDLKKGYEVFNQSQKMPKITFLGNGRHSVR